MNVLLFLSALLSALTGAGIGVRRSDVAQSVASRSVVAQPARIATATLAQRPFAARPTLIVSAMPGLAAALPLPGKTDLWASRRRV